MKIRTSTFTAEFSDAGTPEGDMVRRRARVFAAGDYPDKGLTVTEDDLDKLIAAFQRQGAVKVGMSVVEAGADATFAAPVKLEHADTPLDGALGELASLRREGADLMGELVMPKWLSDHLDASGNKGLSLGFMKDFSGVNEVSLTLTPRVKTAMVFSAAADQITHGGSMSDVAALFKAVFGQEAPMPEKKTPEQDAGTVQMSAAEIADLRAQAEKAAALETQMADQADRVARMEAERRGERADAVIKDWTASGKVTPAMAVFARPLLMQDAPEAVTFSRDGKEEKGSVADLFKSFVGAAPVAIKFGEKGANSTDSVNFSDLNEYLAAEPNDRVAAVKQYQAANKIATFAEADTALRAALKENVHA